MEVEMEVEGNRFAVCCLLLVASCTFLTRYQVHIHLRNPPTLPDMYLFTQSFLSEQDEPVGNKSRRGDRIF